ncbi:ethanolamine utilization protein EutN [Bradyrhizobium yuanmingense]|uniref:Ethanolamine utilization protein EutN n=1 Tax=Bradyrhizobium yuanmingense TaxID=108015 RepID=A0A0R3BW39_9BRAD|nr:EutN/CcmL family microcompartment protein [Bradyrhizobium yuanmingense]KRP89525.1 ethanolamine utilization protein EutN [Bradyrhizobium yuanmingense]
MIRARVSGRVWSTRHIGTLPTGALLEVETETGTKLIAFDPLGCADGETVLVTQGSVAAAFFIEKPAPIDALIVGSIDEQSSKTK